MNSPSSIDIFCSVVDNFGDIGVCWRLARQMDREFHLRVRLFVDDMAAFRTIVPIVDGDVAVHEWTADVAYSEAADIVIEAFACHLPAHVEAAMVAHQSVWMDLEYLTAEDWTAGCHAIPSPHPTLKIKKTLFFPGFDTRTGGLIRENDLILRRNAFQNDKNVQNKWRKEHFIPEIDENCIDISLFCYQTAPIDDVLAGLAEWGRRVRVFRFVKDFSPPLNPPSEGRGKGGLDIYHIPFVSQYDFDYALWTMDMNFVRGEDSFVRAQFARKPFVWNIYPQEDRVHFIKLKAFLDKMARFYEPECFERLANLSNLWNEGAPNKPEYGTRLRQEVQGCLDSLDSLTSGAQKWVDYLIEQPDLATQILIFAEKQINKQVIENKGNIL